MSKPSSTPQAPRISPGMPEEWVSLTQGFFQNVRDSSELTEVETNNITFNDLLRSLLKVERIERGRVTCLLSIKPPVLNFYGTLHGGAVTGLAELVCTACARTIASEDKKLFLGELSVSYLSAATPNMVLEVDGSLVRHGRNVTVTSVEFKNKQTGKLIYTARATFYNLPVSSL
ncbi:acyl-coenzyme A thioesterase 13 [Macadamia integrifolia]|uniref:acyl-coenzyme A thioesterase 13 n=1 Tax=Macadamia integrifolia TaxID=60698 RepID=UPI001C4F379F|nr:acyl-coenzyme A thioesterase 13 [Macadamia integrifolia]XP_042510474.1 acyl-coenzyme A thioesterase 13 [Macadamia integrifolia]